MGQAKLMKATIILPRMETQEAVSKLAELEWFHPLQSATSEHTNPYLDDLLLKAQRLFQDIDEVVRALGIPLETGIMATMFKGAPQGKTDYVINDIENFVADLEDKSKALLYEPKKVLIEQNKISKQIEEYSTVEAALRWQTSIWTWYLSDSSKDSLLKFLLLIPKTKKRSKKALSTFLCT